MQPIEIKPNIFWIGVNDTSTELFEGLWPIEKEGVSYNSYLIKDKKNVLIDLCKELFQDEYLSDLKTLIDPSEIDYLVVNHMEPDHSGALQAFRKMAPQAKILATRKAVQMMEDFFGIHELIQPVSDGEKLSLGEKELTFITAPMVHWPETMMTFEASSGILFSCDAFGGYGILADSIFDDEHKDISFYERESLRYFSNIVAAFSKPVLNAAAKLGNLAIKIIAPSHGLVWRSAPERIIDLYLTWSGYSKGPAERGVTLLYGSMYGNTLKMVPKIIEGLEKAQVPFAAHDITTTHVSYILPDVWKHQGILIGAPTYEGSIFPTMATVLEMFQYKRIFHRQAAYFGSYGWGGGATRYLGTKFETLKWELTETLEFTGQPSEENMAQAAAFSERFGNLIKNI
jgi:anaerobic nitric oxide reductase flavorubredoxin